MAAGLVVVAVVAALITTLFNGDENPRDPNRAAPPARTSTTTSEEQPSPATKSTTTTTNPPTTTEQPPSQVQQPVNTAGTPAQAVTAYYALMPGNLDQAWNRLTPKFQNSPAGGRSSYAGWWSKIRAVTASEVAQTGDNTVAVTILYTFNDGHRVVERHQYTLVNQNGTWLIDAVRILSSGPA